jgi:hypothetical protein
MKRKSREITDKNINGIVGEIKKFFKSCDEVNTQTYSSLIWETNKTPIKNIKITYDDKYKTIYISQEDKGLILTFSVALRIGDRIYMDGNKIITQIKRPYPKMYEKWSVKNSIYVYTSIEKY